MPRLIARKLAQLSSAAAQCFVVLSLGAVHSAFAQTEASDLASQQAAIKLRPSYQKCLDATGGVTPDMKNCMSAEFGYQDKRLNAAYRQLMASIGPDAKSTLRSEERDWIKHKESKCSSGPGAGQADELVAYDCTVNETASRATALEARIPK